MKLFLLSMRLNIIKVGFENKYYFHLYDNSYGLINLVKSHVCMYIHKNLCTLLYT